MKRLTTLIAAICISAAAFSQKAINIHVTELHWEDRNLETNLLIDSATKSCDAVYEFDLQKMQLHYVNDARDIDKTCEILSADNKSGVVSIVYKDVYRFDASIVWYPQVTIDTNKKLVNMVFVERPRNLIGTDNFTKFDLKVTK